MRSAADDFAPFTLTAGSLKLRAARFEAARTEAADKVCVLLNGQTEFIEKYFEVIDDLRRRGFSVVTMDWRGQGGSSRMLANPLKAHIQDFAQYDEDLAILMREVVGPMTKTRKPIALAHSMGGHILLRRLHDVRHEFAAAALCAPMITIQPRKVPWWIVGILSAFINREAPSEDFVPGMAKRDHLTLPFAKQIVTSDPVRYQRTHDVLAAKPSLRLNGPTWGWLAAALKSILTLHQPGYPEAIDTPCLLIAAGHDLVCDSASLGLFAARMPKARLVEIAGAEHEILQERDIYRDQLWAAFDPFMADK